MLMTFLLAVAVNEVRYCVADKLFSFYEKKTFLKDFLLRNPFLSSLQESELITFERGREGRSFTKVSLKIDELKL